MSPALCFASTDDPPAGRFASSTVIERRVPHGGRGDRGVGTQLSAQPEFSNNTNTLRVWELRAAARWTPAVAAGD